MNGNNKIAISLSLVFLPLEDLVVAEYEKKGKEEVGRLFFDPKDHIHTLKPGGELNASLRNF